jgi:prepilin-type N-terminal cleavage/methylation domain-containing protein
MKKTLRHFPPAACRNSGGFTLLELLLAMALSLIVAATLAAALFTAFKARTSANNAVDSTREIATVGDIVEREVANGLPPTPLPAGVGTVTLPGQNSSSTSGILIGPYEGLVDSVDFFESGPEPKAALQGDAREVSFLLIKDPQGTGQALVKRVTTNLLATTPTPDPDEVIARNVTSLEFSYFDGTAWNDTWDSTIAQLNAPINTIPFAVQITIEMAPLTKGGPVRRTNRMVPISAAKPTTQTTPTVTAPSTVTGL